MSPRSKTLSEQMKAKSRSAIISAALELFAKKGFSAATTDEIAKKAKVSKGLIFSHFSTKEDILLALIDERVDQLLPKPSENDDRRTPKEKLISLINAWLELLENNPLLVLLSLRLNLDDGWRKILRRKGKQYIELYFGRMRDLLVQVGSKKPDLDSYLLAVFFDGIAANYIASPELFPINNLKDRLIEILLSQWERQRMK
jgi:AcrR family transcriptional regulator